MVKNAMQIVFNSGEWSPLMAERFDLAGYASSVSKMENMIALPQGPTVRRPGTLFVTKPLRAGKVRLIPYEPNTGQAFVVELGDKYVRVLNSYGPVNNSGVEVWIEAPWTAAEVEDVTYTQCGDRLYFWHQNHRPTYLVRSSTYVWRFEPLAFYDGPWLALNSSSTTISCNGNYGFADVIATASLFNKDDVGRQIRIGHGKNWGWGTIWKYYNSRKVQINIVQKIHQTTSTSQWRLGAWSKKTGYPSCGAFIEDRLFAASSKLEPRTLWASKTASHHNFAPTNKNNSGLDDRIEADCGITITLSDERVRKILWLQAGSNLIAGTTSGEFVISGASKALSPSNIMARRETTRGVAGVRPERLDNSLIYVARGGRQLYEMSWNGPSNAWHSSDISLLANHLFDEKIKEIAMQYIPWPILWMRRADGRLIAVTLMRERNINAWHRHFMGGGGVVENITTISGEDEDTLWMVVRRGSERFIERMANIMPTQTDEVVHYVDCGSSVMGAERNSQGGFNHLEGKSLQILADGRLHDNKVVTGGKISLNRKAKLITAGFAVEASIESVHGLIQAVYEQASRAKNMQSIRLKLWRSAEVTVENACNYQSIAPQGQQFDSLGADLSQQNVYSGFFDVDLEGFWHSETWLKISQKTPLPLNLLAIHTQYC